jgi:hypothetical protein
MKNGGEGGGEGGEGGEQNSTERCDRAIDRSISRRVRCRLPKGPKGVIDHRPDTLKRFSGQTSSPSVTLSFQYGNMRPVKIWVEKSPQKGSVSLIRSRATTEWGVKAAAKWVPRQKGICQSPQPTKKGEIELNWVTTRDESRAYPPRVRECSVWHLLPRQHFVVVAVFDQHLPA